MNVNSLMIHAKINLKRRKGKKPVYENQRPLIYLLCLISQVFSSLHCCSNTISPQAVKCCILGKPSLKKTIFLLTFVNKDFSPPPLIIDKKPLRFGDPVRGLTFIKVKNNIV